MSQLIVFLDGSQTKIKPFSNSDGLDTTAGLYKNNTNYKKATNYIQLIMHD